jgi:hypothetical protein
MKKIILGALILFSITSCAPIKMTALKEVHFEPPYNVTSNKTQQEVWEKIIDLFATKGLSIKIIDKNSGLLTSEKTSFKDNSTIEDKTGKLINPEAYIVTSYYNSMGMIIKPTILTGEWNIRIKEDKENNGTVININLVNIEAVTAGYATAYGPSPSYNFEAKSTGKFEAMIGDYIK